MLRKSMLALLVSLVHVHIPHDLHLCEPAAFAIQVVFYTQDKDRFEQVSWAVLVFGAALILQRSCNPFIEDQLNRLEFLSLATMFSVMFIGTLFLTGVLLSTRVVA